MILYFYSNFLAAILKMANLTVMGLYFSLETVIIAFYGKFPIRMRMSSYSTNDVRMDLFLGFVSGKITLIKKKVYFTILCPFFMSDGRNERVNLPHDRALQ